MACALLSDHEQEKGGAEWELWNPTRGSLRRTKEKTVSGRGDGVTGTVMIIDDGDGVMTVMTMRWCDDDTDDDGVMGTVMMVMVV